MNAFLYEVLAPYNLPYSMLLGLVLIYWFSVFIGALDFDFIDIDADVNTDVSLDMDTEVEVDANANLAFSGDAWVKILTFFNIGAVPFMIFFSFLILNIWMGSVLGNYYLAGQKSWFPWVWILPNLLVALFLTRFFTWPFRRSYKAMTATGMEKKQLVGKTCQLISGLEKEEVGQAELIFNGIHYLLNVKASEKISKGETAILVEYNAKEELYLISEFEI